MRAPAPLSRAPEQAGYESSKRRLAHQALSIPEFGLFLQTPSVVGDLSGFTGARAILAPASKSPSRAIEEAQPQQLKVGATEHAPFDQFEPHPQLSALFVARAVPMARPSYRQASPGESPTASPCSGSCASPLERLESSEAATGVPASGAQPTGGNPGGARLPSRPTRRGFFPVSCSAGTLSPVLDRAAGA